MSRPLPHNLEIERAILGTAIAFPDSVRRIIDSGVSKETFYGYVHKSLWAAIIDINKDGRDADLLAVCDYLRSCGLIDDVGGEVGIAEIATTVATSANVESWVKKHLEYHARRLILTNCITTSEKCYEGTDPALEIYNDHRANLADAETYALGTAQIPTVEKIAGFLEYLEELQAGTGDYVIPWGIDGLDDYIQLQRKELMVLGGLSNTGKTRFILNDAIGRIKRNISVAIFSFENATKKLTSGMVSIESGVSMFSMTKQGELKTEDQIQRIKTAVHFLKERKDYLYYFGKGDYIHTTSGISAEIRRIQDAVGGKLKVVYVDYIQNLRGNQRQGRVEQIESIMAELSYICAEHNVAVIALSQLNRDKDRDKTNRRPILADAKGSGAIENEADYVVFLHRTDKEKGDVQMEIYSEKVRGAQSFSEQIEFNTHTGKFGSIVRQQKYSEEDIPQSWTDKY